MNAPATISELAYNAESHDLDVEELAEIIDRLTDDDPYSGIVATLDMLAGICEFRSELEGDKWERIGTAIQGLSNMVEHRMGGDDD